jgi:hypothetical protein
MPDARHIERETHLLGYRQYHIGAEPFSAFDGEHRVSLCGRLGQVNDAMALRVNLVGDGLPKLAPVFKQDGRNIHVVLTKYLREELHDTWFDNYPRRLQYNGLVTALKLIALYRLK